MHAYKPLKGANSLGGVNSGILFQSVLSSIQIELAQSIVCVHTMLRCTTLTELQLLSHIVLWVSVTVLFICVPSTALESS